MCRHRHLRCCIVTTGVIRTVTTTQVPRIAITGMCTDIVPVHRVTKLPRNVYTPEEDELIKAARQDELTDLAVRLGRKRYNIVNRRTRLLRGELGYTSFRKPSPAERAKALTANVTA